VAEIVFKWRRGKLPGVPEPATWVAHALENFVLVNASPQAAMRAGLWNWDHGDLVDRMLAAIACEEDVLLVHTDRLLKDKTGFPQRYFRSVAMSR
jgi:PIN domain nuclease of toxin-antitoxin system